MQFGSDNWGENDTTDALNNALFGGNKKNVIKSITTKKKKTAKQIDQETKQAKEFLQNFKSVQKSQKIVQFDVSDSDSDDGNDLSKRAKKNLKERNRKKRKKELKRKENVKRKKDNLDSDEELFAQIDEEDDQKQYVPENVPKMKNICEVQKSEKPKKVKKTKKEKIKKKISMETENLQTESDINKKEKVDNPFQCETQNLSKKQKKKLKKKANKEKLAKEMKNTTNKTSNYSGKSFEPLNKKSMSKLDIEGSEEKPEKKKKCKMNGDTEIDKNTMKIKADSFNNEGREGKLEKKKKSKVKAQIKSDNDILANSVRSDIEVNNSNKMTDTESKLGSEGKPLKKKKSKVNGETKIDSNTSKNVGDNTLIDTFQKSKKKRKNSETGGDVKIPEKRPKIDSDLQQKVDKNMQKNKKEVASIKNETSSKTSENEKRKASKFNTSKLSNILANKNSGLQTPERNQDKKDSKNKKETKTLQERMKNQLNEARFRFLNEQLYTQTGPEAFSMFQADQESFKVYHEGFQSQVSKWPVNPLDIIINQVKKLPKTHIIADFGCGTADLAQSVPQKVHSFDLVPLNKFVTVCDISKVPLPTKSIDVAVFCLSLMGTNLNDYIAEANRVLKPGGELKIAEVESRIAHTQNFITQVESFGFQLLEKETSHKMFHLFYFNKVKPCIKSAIQDVQLEPCIYKRR